jgi:hypothetical protein
VIPQPLGRMQEVRLAPGGRRGGISPRGAALATEEEIPIFNTGATPAVLAQCLAQRHGVLAKLTNAGPEPRPVGCAMYDGVCCRHHGHAPAVPV